MHITDDYSELLALGRGASLSYDISKTVIDLISEQAKQSPEAVAVKDRDSEITYHELEVKSDMIAEWLIEEKAVQSDDFVVVEMPRIKEFIIAVMGIWNVNFAAYCSENIHEQCKWL